MSWLLGAAWLTPLGLAALAHRGRFWWTPALGALAALAAAIVVPLESELSLPWLLMGTLLRLDEPGRIFLLFSAVLWTVAGIHATTDLRHSATGGRYRTLFLIAMAGNLLLIVGGDLVTFYTGFALMGIASYGLVIHGGGAQALRAGQLYLVMTVAAELALFATLVLMAKQAGSLTPTAEQLAGLDDLTLGLLVLGLGIKAGLVPLHVWLPLAYPAAPPSAAAVLAGAMSKVALLGWLRYLPLGAVASPEWGAFLILLGLASLLLALPTGLVQADARAVLAYSSIAKAGLLVLTLGLVLMEPGLGPVGVAAVALFAAHHGLVKGALFLGVGLMSHRPGQTLVYAGLAFLALALAGAPLTSGAVAKFGIKPPLAAADWGWLGPLVAASTVAMALLMIRFLWRLGAIGGDKGRSGVWPIGAWLLLIGVVAAFPFVSGSPPAAWVGNSMSIAVALGLAAPFALAARLRPSLLRPLVGKVPPGDLLAITTPLARALVWLGQTLLAHWLHQLESLRRGLRALVRGAMHPNPDPERGLRSWATSGTLWLALLALLLLSVVFSKALQVTPLGGPG